MPGALFDVGRIGGVVTLWLRAVPLLPAHPGDPTIDHILRVGPNDDFVECWSDFPKREGATLGWIRSLSGPLGY